MKPEAVGMRPFAYDHWGKLEDPLRDRLFTRKKVLTGLLSLSSLLCLVGCWGGDIPSASKNAGPDTAADAPLSIATSSLPAATEGQAYIATLAGTGGMLPYTWLVTPSLPEGLVLDPTTGEINGSPSGWNSSTTNYDFELQD